MKAHEFCYWLQGLFELGNPQQLDEKQTKAIKAHLALVFRYDIDPLYGDAEEQKKLQEIHDDGWPGDQLIRC